LGKKHPQIKLESGAMAPSFGYSAGVFSKSIPRDGPCIPYSAR